MSEYNMIIVGVGGQGTLLAAKILGRLCVKKGYDCKVSEVHGMSQRGGSVMTYVRFGDKIWSPIVDKGEAHLILSFELLEAARYLDYLRPDGTVITSTQQINPMPVISGETEYPEGLLEEIAKHASLQAFDALALAEEAGTAKAANVVLLGRLSRALEFSEEEWLSVIRESVPEKFAAVNERAFLLGRAE